MGVAENEEGRDTTVQMLSGYTMSTFLLFSLVLRGVTGVVQPVDIRSQHRFVPGEAPECRNLTVVVGAADFFLDRLAAVSLLAAQSNLT